jgi:hemoglobin
MEASVTTNIQTETSPRISEAQIANLVESFYDKVRLDPEIGPVFNATITDWPAHIALLKNFWSTVLLTTGRYKGDPMMTHLGLPIEHNHFDRWLHLFEETAVEVLPPHLATLVVSKAHRIAANFKMGIALNREKSASATAS